jgi:hypothetical protein
MALINWGDEEDKKDDLFGSTPIKQVASVQSGSWQPAPSGANAPAVQEDEQPQGGIFGQQTAQAVTPVQQNYLVSDEKAQVDERKRQQDAQVEEARRQAAAEAAAEQSRQFNEGKAQDSKGQPLDVEAIKADNGWRKYYDQEFKREKDSLDFWGRLMDGGAASRRAEVAARGKYNTELLYKAYDDNGNVLDPDAAIKAKRFAAYNSALAEDNSTRSRAAGEAIGAFDKTDSGFFGRLNDSVNAMRQMSVFDAAAGVDDKQKTGVDDVFRFGGNVIQGVATALPTGGKAVYESARGKGTDYSTGFEKELDAGERTGRGVSGAIDVVGTFFGGSGKLVQSLGGKVAKGAATQAEKTLLKRLTAEYIIPSLIEGGEAGAQAAAEYFGNNGTLMDENGEIDADKVAELLTQTGEAFAVGTAAGGVFTGTAAGVNRFRNRGGGANAGAMSEFEYTPVEDIAPVTGEDFTPFEKVDPIEGGSQQVADGVAVPENVTPVGDSNVSFEPPANIVDGVPVTPAPAMTRDSIGISDTTPVAEGTVTTMPAEVTPVRAPEIEAPVARPAEAPVSTTDVTPVADGVVQQPLDSVMPVRDQNMPIAGAEEVRALQDARAGKSQAEEAAINQQLLEAENATPRIDDPNAPLEGVTPVRAENLPEMEVPGDGRLTPQQVSERLMPKLADNSDVKRRVAEAVGMGKDSESPIRDILRDGGVNPKKAERIATKFDKLEQQLMDYNRLEEMNQKAYAEGGTDAIDSDVGRERSRVGREMGITTRRLMRDIQKLEGSRDKKIALINNITDIIGTRNASVLSSAGLLERNIFQELTANVKLAVKNPIKMAKSTFGNGNILKDTAKSELSHWADKPSVNPVDAVKYVVGNTYRTGMIPTTALANTRRGAIRDELTKWAFQELEGRKVSSKEAHKLAGTAGNEMEALVNTIAGVDNGMTNRGQAKKALDAWKEYIRTGDDGAKAEFLARVENHDSLADQMIAGLSKEDQTRARGLMAAKNLIFPFVRTATNLAKNIVRQDLNPFAKSLLDEIGADQRGITANTINTIKSKLVDYGIMGGAAALASSGVLVYNDGDEVDKPKGWSIKVGDNKYVPVRSTSLELPIALAGTAQAMFSDITDGNPRDWQYYAGMVTNSLPYIDQFNTTTGAVDSLTSGEDEGYAAKSYGVNMAKSFVPFSNNGVQPYIAGKQGESLNAKTVYDDDLKTWFTNTVRKSYDPDFYNGLKDSRDNAGRVRTVDNQGVVSNKTMNDASTAEFNDRITDLVDYGREAGLGKSTKDMFNTYDTGKNNNFKSVQDSITFLDAVDGKPDNTKKLEKNGKLSGLSKQMRDGFYGDTGAELLTLDGKNLKSDASVPNGAGSKNSKLPLSMASIRNAIAQTDLGTEGSDKLFAISGQSTELYNQLKNKQISYEQYLAAKNELSQQESAILSASPNYQRLNALMTKLDESGFFEAGGLGSTKSGQTYLWNSLNALLASKGATPAAQYPEDDKGFTPWGNNGKRASDKPGDRGNTGIEWTPVKARQAANVARARFTPVNIKVKLGNEVRKDRSQNYSDRSF